MENTDLLCRSKMLGKRSLASLCLCVSVVIGLSCGSKPTDPRTVIPADSLVYLESSDVGRVLDAITSNPIFQQLAKTKPDTSALNGIRLSVAVTGFQTSEEAEGESGSVLDFRPRFVAVAETNAWNYQALSFAENKLGEFVNDVYGGEVELVTIDKHGGSYFTWTAKDGRKAFALVRGSLVLFGNDESAIDNCVNVMNGGAENIERNPKVSAFAADSLASGYVSKDGVDQIANIAGVSLASGAGEEAEVKSFIARVLPDIARNSMTEMTWQARRAENGRIEDSYTFSLTPDTARVLSESIVPGGRAESDLGAFIPREFVSATRYDLKNAQVAWRSVLLTARTKTDQVSGNLLAAFSSSLFEPYGIEDPELFFRGVWGPIQTIRFDADGDEVVVIARIEDPEAVRMAVAKELGITKFPFFDLNGPPWAPKRIGSSADGDLAAASNGYVIIVGDAASVDRCIAASAIAVADTGPLQTSTAAAATIGTEADPRAGLIAVLADRKDDTTPLIQNYFSETRFSQNGIERRTVSDFGLIGMIIERIDPDS